MGYCFHESKLILKKQIEKKKYSGQRLSFKEAIKFPAHNSCLKLVSVGH